MRETRQPGGCGQICLASLYLLRAFLASLGLFLLSACTGLHDGYDQFSTDVTPRLQNNEPERIGAVINEAAFNAGAVGKTVAPYSGFVGTLRVNYAANRAQIESDLITLGQAVPPDFDPNEMVTIDFTDASMGYILEQLLTGALGINYIAPDNLPTGIDLRIDSPLPKSRVLQVVRDLLSRNGLMMRFFNGVFQIGTPETIEALQVNSAAGRQGEDVTKVVKLGRGNAPQVVALASQLLPPNVGVLVTSATDAVVIQAHPNDLDSVERLVLTLSHTAAANDRVAIIPLQRSAPEAVAAQLNQFYAPSLREGEGTVNVVPLRAQQAILVSASDPALMGGIQQIARQLDRSVTDVVELRVIALTHVRAEHIAPQLGQIFAATAAAPVPQQPREDPGATTGVMSRLRPPQAQPPSDNQDGTGLAVPTPVAPPVADNSGAAGANRGNEANEKGPFDPSTMMVEGENETRIVADPRTNSLLVYSTYSVYKRMREVVKTLDVAQAQVIIEATVLEVQLNQALGSGVQFFLQSHGVVLGSGIPSGNQSPDLGGVFGVGADIGTVRVDAVLHALRSVTDLKVISSPYLTVVDGQSARLVIGDQIPFAATSQTSNNAGTVTVTQNIEILDTGVVLEITPTIHANNSVQLNIIQSVSTPSSSSEAGSLTPTIATRDISSQVLAQSGRTILLGGLIQERIQQEQDGVPIASEVPVLGALFRQNRTVTERTELLVLITPRVVRNSSEIERITRMLQSAQTGIVYSDPKNY